MPREGLLNLQLLGGLRIELQGHVFSDRLARKSLALVSYLAMTGVAQPRGSLAALLWSDFPENRARSNLRDTLTTLRRTPLKPYVGISRRSICFSRDLPFWLDAAAFQNGVGRSRDQEANDLADLEKAVGYYKGDFLAGFEVSRAALFEEWLTVQRQRLHLLAIDAFQQLVDLSLDSGLYELGISFARQLLDLDPWREASHRNLMLLQLLDGQPEVALVQYEDCRQILADELGVDPAHETTTLYNNIRTQVGRSEGNGPVRLAPGIALSRPSVPNNLPGKATPFIGREEEIQAIDRMLISPDARLITILGVGGVGKTRLGLCIGEKQIEAFQRNGAYRFPDGVYFVSFEGVKSPSGVLPALIQAIGFQPATKDAAGRTVEQQLLHYLRPMRMLLILDNFEHLLNGVGLLSRILHQAPEVCLLVTSRERLALHAERPLAISGLSYPGKLDPSETPDSMVATYSAAGLFLSAAQRVRTSFHLKKDDLPSLARICRLVDGLPLAIELAAGWTGMLSLEDIAAEIDEGLSFLESDLSDLPARHRNIQAVFDVSWQRLSQEERTVFKRLTVFRGGFTRVAAEEVFDTSLRQLATLVNRAFIQYDRKTNRYQMHRLLRVYGGEKLAADPPLLKSASARHCEFFMEALNRWDWQMKGADQLKALAEFDQESDNVRAAWNFALESGEIDCLEKAVDGLGRLYLWRRRFQEGQEDFWAAETGLDTHAADRRPDRKAPGIQLLMARLLIWRTFYCRQDTAIALVKRALAILDDLELAGIDSQPVKAFAYRRAGEIADDRAQSERYYRRSLEYFQAFGDDWGTASVLIDLGWAAAHHGRTKEATRLGEQALQLHNVTGDLKGKADALWLLGTIAITEDRIIEATQQLGESLDLRIVLGDRLTDIAAGPIDLGMTLTWIGRMDEADQVREETLAVYKALDLKEKIAEAHVRLSTSKIHVGQFDEAERQAFIGLELCRKVGNRRLMGIAYWNIALKRVLLDELDETEQPLQESMVIFQTLEGAGELSWAYALQAELARKRGQVKSSKEYMAQSLRLASGLFGMISTLTVAAVYANLLADQGRSEEAVEYKSFLNKHPFIQKSAAASLILSERLVKCSETLPQRVVKDAERRGRERGMRKIAAGILAELEEDFGG